MRKSALFWFGLVVTTLVALGLVVLSSASEANAIRLHNGDPYFFMKRQFAYLGGGIVIAVADSLQIPVKYIGVGEGIDDLMPFQSREFVEALI